MPFSFRVRLAEEEVGIPIVEPAEVTQRLLNESGMVERGTPVMRVRLGSIEYEFRTLFRCYIGVRVDAGQSLSKGVILAAGGADGEELPDGPQSFSAHQVQDRTMSAAINRDILNEIQPTVQALQAHGFELAATEGEGMTFWADFRSPDASLRMVNDRGYWHVAGDIDDPEPAPSRKSQNGAIRDALDWIATRRT
jgi:hypothetical protein